MEVYQTDNHYIIQDGEYSLWCSRKHGTLEPKTANDLCSAWNPVCIGLVYGVIGKIKIHPESDWKLLLISKQTCVGQLCGEDDVYQINRIVVLSLSDAEPVDIELDLCKKHHFGIKRTDRITQNADGQGKSLQKTWNIVKSAAENVKPKKKEVKDKEKFEKRILEELIKMYNETNSFYYCESHDLTNTIQRQYQTTYNKSSPLSQRCDERFFWNLHMMKELTEMKTELAYHWILPIVQGCVDIQTCTLDFSDANSDLSPIMPVNRKLKDAISYKLILISRRSRHRAGTRSKRRGLDETGACSNYVETEQIIEFSHHRVSFVQVRGSIPVFWSQTGVKYRPPPKVDKGEAETYEAFKKHADEQLSLYKSVSIITLAELTGKEKAIGDAFLNNMLKYNSQDVTYVTFDFHEYCRGMKFENVSILTSGIKDIIKHMRYCWVDRKPGMICEQRGVFRVNCIDCLDRTNVVQTAIARIVMETQCRKLGLLAPDENLPENCRKIYQQTWANTGDAISKQYAGTAALKGDFTRTGERKISGMMKDGVNSANRYYLRFKDTYRQAAIDLTHGQPVSEDILSGKLKVPEEDVRELMEKEENVKMLIEDSKKMLIVEPEECIGGWSLINADPTYGDSDRQEMDIILLLSQRAVYVAWYDDEEEQVTQYQRIFLEDIEKIEIGAEPSLFKSKNIVMRLHYRNYADEGFFHSFRSTGTRLFNNLVIAVKTHEEAKEQLNVVSETFAAAQNILSLELTILEKQKLNKKKSLPHPNVMDIHQQLQENSLSKIKLPRDVSSSDIPSQASSRGTSPMFGRKLSPTPLPSLGERRDNQSTTVPHGKNASKGTALTSWLPEIPKFQKPTNPRSFDLAVPKLNMKSLNLVSKLKSGRAGAGRLLSKMPGTSIFCSNENNNENNPPTDEVDMYVAQEPKTKVIKRQFSRDDSFVDEPPEMTQTDLELEVMLDSCGILATKTKQILESPQFSLEEPDKSPDDDVKTSEEVSKTGDDLSKEESDRGSAIFNIGGGSLENSGETQNKLDVDNDNISNDVLDSAAKNKTVGGEAMQKRRSTSFQCFCSQTENCPHKTMEVEDIWVKRADSIDNKDKVPKNLDLNLGPKRVIDNSEADKILEKYSKSKKVLHHPNMRNSLSDTSIATSITITTEGFEKDSPKSLLEMDLEINSELKQKLPNLLQSSKLPRKSQRVYDNLKSHIQNQLGDTICQSTIILI